MIRYVYLSATVLLLTPGQATASESVAWQYHIRQDLHGDGLASPIVVDRDGLCFTTQTCVYNEQTGACVNTTGELIILDAATGDERSGTRFDGAGLNGELGKPRPPVIIKDEAKGTHHAAVMGGETILSNQWMHYFAAGISLDPSGTTCDVPLASGNRMVHAINESTQAACTAAQGQCWAGSDGSCGLVDTAQTTDCAAPNPWEESDCLSKGCCWDGKYSPGRCFQGSPKCYKAAAQTVWLTPRPSNNTWESTPAPSQSKDVVVMAQCQGESAYKADKCQLAAYKNGQPLWQAPIAPDCKSGASVCLCTCIGPCMPAPAIGADGAYFVACSTTGLVLLGHSLETGTSLWPAQALGAVPGISFEIQEPPAPIYSFVHDIVYVSGWGGGDTAAISARSPQTGKEIWKDSVSGHKCTSIKWSAVAALSKNDDLLLVWDNFAIRALSAKTGKESWSTATQGIAIMSQLIPGVAIQDDNILVVSSKEARSCDSVVSEAPAYITAVSSVDGSVLGNLPVPGSQSIPAYFSPPVAWKDLWIIRGDTSWPHSHSTVYAMKAPKLKAHLGKDGDTIYT